MNILVRNLERSVTEAELLELFKPFGKVESAVVVMDAETGKSKGFGFVEFETEEQAQAAIQALDGSEQDGRNIAVKEALPRPDRPQM